MRVSLLRETRQTAKLRILVDGIERLEMLVCDGALVATPAWVDGLQPCPPTDPLSRWAPASWH